MAPAANDSLTKEYIAAGTYQLAEGQPRLLTALLGTCVGIAIFDKQAGVGGLLHLLLPEPTGAAPTWQPVNYATTGLPLFLETLSQAGADRKRLTAVIAGGALYAPISKQDLEMDIGGRTTEAAIRILQKEQIAIIKTETGGCCGASLTLNTATWETAITPIFQPPGGAPHEDFRPPTEHELDAAIARISPIPQIALKIIRLIRQDKYSIKDLEPEIWIDQVIAAKVLRLCNSVLVGPHQRIDSIGRALVLLGENQLIELIVSAALDTFYQQREGGYALMRGGLYRHSLCVANAAKIIAAFAGRTDPEAAYTAGLLHDIGKVVLDQYFVKTFPLFYQSYPLRSGDFSTLEKQTMGVDHQEIGQRLAELWNLPANLAEAIRFHHYPERATVDARLTHVVYLADLLTSWFLAGVEQEWINAATLTTRLAALDLSPAQLPVLIDKIPWQPPEYA